MWHWKLVHTNKCHMAEKVIFAQCVFISLWDHLSISMEDVPSICAIFTHFYEFCTLQVVCLSDIQVLDMQGISAVSSPFPDSVLKRIHQCWQRSITININNVTAWYGNKCNEQGVRTAYRRTYRFRFLFKLIILYTDAKWKILLPFESISLQDAVLFIFPQSLRQMTCMWMNLPWNRTLLILD